MQVFGSKVSQNSILWFSGMWLKILLCTTLVGCGQSMDYALTIAVAANMQFAMEEIVSAFEEKTNLSCATVVSSSGKLTAQISKGAPFDVFVSADMKYPEELFRAGLIKEKPTVYAYGKLIMWSAIEELQPSINQLLSPEVKHVALPNPKTAPYGIAAMEVLKHHGLLESIQKKLVFGESISQTNQFILSRSAEIGFTSKSVVLSSRMKEQGSWVELNQDLYTPLAQGVVILSNERRHLSKQFFDFLFSPEGQMILQKFGYDTPPDA